MGTTFSGTITNTAGLTKVGSGRLVLSGANTYSVVPRARGRYAQPCQQPGARDRRADQHRVGGRQRRHHRQFDHGRQQDHSVQVPTGTATQAGLSSTARGREDRRGHPPLVLGNGGTSRSVAGNVVNDSFAINRGDTSSFGGLISAPRDPCRAAPRHRAHRQQQLEGATTASTGTLMVSSSTVNSAVTVKAAPCSLAAAWWAITINPGGIFTAGANGTMTVASKPGPIAAAC
jgi:hypothetical protein